MAGLALLFSIILCYHAACSLEELQTCTTLEGITMCEPLGYGSVTMPNHRGHANHSEVNEELQDFEELVESGCSLYLRHFLCAYYAPLCRVYLPLDHGTVPPCRGLCTHVRERCEPVMAANGGVEWPDHLDCGSFPVKKDVPWCFGPDNIAQLNEESVIVTSTEQILATVIASTVSITTAKPTKTPHQSLVPSPSSPPHHEQYECMYMPSDSICTSLNYTRAIYPNYMGHKTAGEAEKSLQTTFDIVLFYCSPHIVPLLCYYYHPQCADEEATPTPVPPPCQEMCSDVETKCHSKYNDKWPKDLDCTKLPSLNDSNTVCKMANELNTTSTISTATPTVVGVGGASTIITMGTPITILIALAIAMVTRST